jgi:hypothetical protein
LCIHYFFVASSEHIKNNACKKNHMKNNLLKLQWGSDFHGHRPAVYINQR